MIGSPWRRIIWGVVSLFIVVFLILLIFGKLHAQVTQGTVNSKTDDGVGNKITSTVVGPSRGLDVNVIAGGGSSGVSYLDADGIANQTANAVHGQTYMYNGATWDRVRGAILTGLEVNCITGCAGGASTPSDAFANPTTAGLQMGFNMVYNGATWDRLRGTVAGGALVNISNASLAVTGTFFQAIQPVSGTVAVTQSTSPWVISGTVTANAGTNLNTSALLLDATFTGRFPVAYVDADAIANQTTTAIHGQGYFYNGVTWDRMRGTIAGGLLVDVSDAFLLDATFTTRINTLGQKAMAASTPVVLASDQTSIPVAATVSNSFLLDATFTGRFAAAYVDADTIANQTTTAVHGQLYGYNGVTWDRLRATTANGLAVDVTRVTGNVAVTNAGLTNIDVALSTRLAESTFTGRFVAATLDADALVNETTTAVHGKCYLYNGTTWDRCRGAVATGLLVNISNATLAVTQSGTWNIGTVTSITNTVTVQGAKTNNNAAPGATNVGVLPCIANAAAPSNTEGNQTLCNQNLLGAQRVIEQNFVATSNNDGACPSGAASFTALASNASRTWAAVWASPANTDDVYIKLGATATSSDARFSPGQALNITSGRIYTGVIDAFPNSGTQAVCVMELN